MPTTPNGRRLHRLRGGDGPSVPSTAPAELWPDLSEIEPYWESFLSFAHSELRDPEVTFIQAEDGSWQFRAVDGRRRHTERSRRNLVYRPEDDEIEFSDPEVGGGWVLEDAFGGDPYAASSAL